MIVPLHETLTIARKGAIIEALQYTQGNITKAARLLQCDRTYIHKLMNTLGIEGKRKKVKNTNNINTLVSLWRRRTI